MSDVTVSYNGSKIVEISGTGNKTLNTAGTYCESNIEIDYTPSTRTYEIELTKASGWVLLTALDSAVLDHINDASLIVTLTNISGYVFESYSVAMAIASNTSIGTATTSEYPVYGVFAKQSNATNISMESTYYPANKSDTSLTLGNSAFRVADNSYYIHPSDGFIRAGAYKLTFTW